MLLQSFSASDIVNLIIWKQFFCTLLAMQRKREKERESACKHTHVQAKCVIKCKASEEHEWEGGVNKNKQEELEEWELKLGSELWAKESDGWFSKCVVFGFSNGLMLAIKIVQQSA